MPVLALPFAPLRPFVAPVFGPFVSPVTPALPFGVEATHHQAKRSHTGKQEEKTLFHGDSLGLTMKQSMF
jgi:hypothetical protein